MQRLPYILLVAFMLQVSDAALGASSAHGREWIVRSGDTLFVLAARFGTTVDLIRQWNELDDDVIRVGQRLVINGGEPSVPRAHTVVADETLSEIAHREGIRLEDIIAWNEGINPDRIVPGQKVQLRGARPKITYRVREGDRLARIARRHGVTVGDIRGWNRNVEPRRLQVGQQLVLHPEKTPTPDSESVGSAWRGQLRRAERLPSHPAYVLRDRNRAWGTNETVSWTVEAFDALRAAHPTAARVQVHDISLREGGPMTDHRSHQSGRDLDVAFLRRQCRPNIGCAFVNVSRRQLDARRQWTLIDHWVRRERVESIFMDYSLQKPLYEEAVRRGATRRQLHRWFQYPRGDTFPVGIIRHYRKHKNHMHVRFRCPQGDTECR